MYDMQKCMGVCGDGTWPQRAASGLAAPGGRANKKGPRRTPLHSGMLGRLGETDHGGRHHEADGHQNHGDETIELPFKMTKRRERHDTHLPVRSPRGSGGRSYVNGAKIAPI